MSPVGIVRVEDDDDHQGIRVDVQLTPDVAIGANADAMGPARATAVAAAGWIAQQLADAGEDVVSLEDVNGLPEVDRAFDLVDRGARALREHRNIEGVGDPKPWAQAPDRTRQVYRDEARAVLTAAGVMR